MKTVLVTGATGFLGQSIVKELLRHDSYGVIAVEGLPGDKVNPLPEHPRLKLIGLDRLFTHPLEDVDTVINCAFPRSNDPATLARAFDFTEKLIGRLKMQKVKSVVNISSQGVYERLPAGQLSTEDSPVVPIDLYSMAKFASEKMFRASGIPHVTNVRMASLMMPQRFLYAFVKKAVSNEPIVLTAPYQYASFLDVTDAASGILSIVALDPEKRAAVYNLGTGVQYSLLQYAESVKEIGDRLGYSVTLEVSDNGTRVCAGMDITRLTDETGWKPAILKDEMILNLFRSIGAEGID